MQNIERRVGRFLDERRINSAIKAIEPFSRLTNQGQVDESYARKVLRSTYGKIANLYSNGDPQVYLWVFECFKDLFADLAAKKLITRRRAERMFVPCIFSPVELLKPSKDDTLDDRPKLKRLLDEMVSIKRIGRDFEVTDLSKHSVSSASSQGTYTYQLGDYRFLGDPPPQDLQPNVIEIGENKWISTKMVTPPEMNPGDTAGYNDYVLQTSLYTGVWEATAFQDTIYGRIVPKSSSSRGRKVQS